MNEKHFTTISDELGLKEIQVKAVESLLEEGATIPFIARYRKEATGSLDEIAVTSIRDRLKQLDELDGRRKTILQSLEKHGHLTDELKESVLAAETLSVLEDIYLPYRPKRRTKASIAREKGLEPLALDVFEQSGINPAAAAEAFVDADKGVDTLEDALSGARHIIAEIINEDPHARSLLRELYAGKAVFKSRVASGMEQGGAKYKDYFDWEESASAAPSHRVLAMLRGEKKGVLNLTIAPPEDEAVQVLEDLFVKGNGLDSDQVRMAVHDSYKRLLSRSMETEMRMATKERADTKAIRVFADNLRQLLLAPPLGAKRVMGIDPGFRTGCKVVCLDPQGKLLHNDTVYPHISEKQTEKAGKTVKSLCERFDIEAIAVGNGTAGRETEAFLKQLNLRKNSLILLVNESGASVYSASEAAREEFPDHDLTVRGAVSIGRRLMDPLAELVKIDPKSIGVGQYQHDVDQPALKGALDDVVISCVNSVGVDVNRASVQLLTYVSGLGPRLANNIVMYRDENGAFVARDDLRKVPRLGPKAFEQSTGFLRIKNSRNPLDASAVHPESYEIVYSMADDLGRTVPDLMNDAELKRRIDISKYVTESVGVPTLKDILEELAKPGRDPREEFEEFAFASDIEKIEDLEPGLKLPGVVTNVTAFGAFVDIGVHQDGLVHISELADRFVKDPAEVVKVNQKVMVTIIDVDLERNRISLSLKSNPGKKPQISNKRQKRKPKKRIREKQGKTKNTPFNNPFADIFKSS
ncbi:MAG: RNA-binding transcriptional accessory protein [Desulfobacterales bacterium PC51MH44]|nr:MAG: RNA-binding transcriptional accessory protein [Desulfobacterales bacterium PC51MH44]